MTLKPDTSASVATESGVLTTDEQLMLAYQAGDISAFEQLYKKHKGPLYRYFVRQLRDNTLAEDLYQEVWGKVIKAVATYQVSAKFTTWLYKIAHNLIIDHIRAVKPLDDTQALGEDQTMDSFNAASEVEPDQQLLQLQQAKLLQGCIDLLPAVQKEAFLLNVELGLTASAISDIAKVTLEATKSRIRYAYQSIKLCVTQKTQEA
ncbi:sigma-70 family RNA polymerase sigma factor [Shewanella subflava]|uniref:Sigma-70 family RNA polymerase sigma factor n=1 Tax=Shewanella subflava TaxID=2986476 RepID=A0ABT3I8B6_9GAMM|nr:sigma-70 family RNA polymerase sigma factor [Shewanella subflava]MCW3172270.1 sigma-70 family RNA polymerase sigma factor [Shewanella subflava]